MNDDQSSIVWNLLTHFALLSVMAIGGGIIALAPDIHRYMVDVNHWISSEQFAAAFTIAQAAPGPNMLFITLIGWQAAGFLGAITATLAVIIPPSLITISVMHVGARQQRDPTSRMAKLGRAIRIGLAPVSVGLLLASGWILAQSSNQNWHGLVVTVITIVVILKTKINPVWLIAIGAAIGLLGWV